MLSQDIPDSVLVSIYSSYEYACLLTAVNADDDNITFFRVPTSFTPL